MVSDFPPYFDLAHPFPSHCYPKYILKTHSVYTWSSGVIGVHLALVFCNFQLSPSPNNATLEAIYSKSTLKIFSQQLIGSCFVFTFLGGTPTSICHFFHPSVRLLHTISQEPYIIRS